MGGHGNIQKNLKKYNYSGVGQKITRSGIYDQQSISSQEEADIVYPHKNMHDQFYNGDAHLVN